MALIPVSPIVFLRLGCHNGDILLQGCCRFYVFVTLVRQGAWSIQKHHVLDSLKTWFATCFRLDVLPGHVTRKSCGYFRCPGNKINAVVIGLFSVHDLMFIYRCFQINWYWYCWCILQAVAYLGFPAPGGKLSFGTPTQSVHDSMDAKNELGVRGVESWLGPCNHLHIIVSRPVWKLPAIVTSQNWRQDLSILEIINYRRVKNLTASREAILSEILVTIEHSNYFITTHPDCGNTFLNCSN